MKTIFITIFQGVEAKNILRTDIYKKLMEKGDCRLVFFVKTPERAEYYRQEFSHPNVTYEVVSERKTNQLDKLFSALKFYLLRTETVDLRRSMSFQENRNYFWYFGNLFLNRLLARPWIRKIIRWLDCRLAQSETFKVYFAKYRPDLVFSAHLFDDLEIDLIREAKSRRVRAVGFINSWDKLTARSAIRILPDKLIVFNNIVKKEAIDHADMPESSILVAGIPQYDWHLNHKPLKREEFFRKKGLDPKKKLIVYAPMGKAFSNSDWDIIDLLNNLITNNSITTPSQLFVRFQPNDFTDEAEIKKRPWLIYDLPGVRFSSKRGVDWDMSFEDIKGLTDTLANADLFVCYASSMSIDAAVFDKPVINIDFEVKEKELMSKSPTYFYRMTHYQNAVKTGGIAYPKSKEEFLKKINDYLRSPSLDKAGRKRLVEEQCWQIDGRAGERIANFLYEY
jgi:hypothetical protein